MMVGKFSYGRLSLILCLGLLGACQTAIKSEPEPLADGWLNSPSVFATQRDRLTQLQGWKLTAKVGIKTVSDNESANLIWTVTGTENEIRLYGPLGVGAVRLSFNGDRAVLKDNKGVEHVGVSPQELLMRVVGWTMPIDSLAYWVFGVPNESQSYQYQVFDGRVSLLDQGGWLINYETYKPLFLDDITLPKKITAKRTLLINGEESVVRVRLVAKSWTRTL